MKKAILLCGMLLAVAASVATAGPGVGIRWTSCLGSPTAQPNRAFLCNTNTGTVNQLVCSFQLPADQADVSGNEIVIDLAAAGATVPAWWQFKNTGTCRQSALTNDFVFVASYAPCEDWAAGAEAGNIGAYTIGYQVPNRARAILASAVAPDNLQQLFGSVDYFCLNLKISNAKTVGTGACAGCLTPVCIVLSSVKVVGPNAANNIKLSGASNGTDGNYVTWQGGAGVSTNLGGACPAATPSQNRTWGQVKALYR